MFFFTYLEVILSLLTNNIPKQNPFVIGGQNAVQGQFPYMASLQWSSRLGNFPSHHCGGTLISDEWILTAAHCIVPIKSNETVYAYIGWIKLSEFLKGKFIKVEKYIYHEDYDEEFLRNDVGLMKLSTKVEFSDIVQPIKLSKENFLSEEEHDSQLVGWGVTTPEGKEASDNLLYTNLTTMDNLKCNKTLFGAVTYNHLCAGNEEKNQCSGDSGGPLVYQGEQVGIVSWSVKPCGFYGSPGVFTRVSKMIDWIQNHTGLSF